MFKISDTSSTNKNQIYGELIEYADMLTEDENDYIANLANISALLNQVLNDINWVGFYIARDNQLVLGPFQGSPACIRIEKGRGVCGKAYELACAQLVDNVHQFTDHITCDSNTNSEIAVPIIFNDTVAAVLDIDSPDLSRFDKSDKEHLESLCKKIAKACIWSNLSI